MRGGERERLDKKIEESNFKDIHQYHGYHKHPHTESKIGKGKLTLFTEIHENCFHQVPIFVMRDFKSIY